MTTTNNEKVWTDSSNVNVLTDREPTVEVLSDTPTLHTKAVDSATAELLGDKPITIPDGPLPMPKVVPPSEAEAPRGLKERFAMMDKGDAAPVMSDTPTLHTKALDAELRKNNLHIPDGPLPMPKVKLPTEAEAPRGLRERIAMMDKGNDDTPVLSDTQLAK